MHIILGGTGHVGSSVVRMLLSRGEAVTVVTRDAGHAEHLRDLGATIAVAGVEDVGTLRRIFRSGRRAFLLNPPGDISKDPSAAERRTISSIVTALEGSGLEKIVVASTYGAQSGELIGDLGTLYEMEQALTVQPIPVTVNRAAYYMSNWDASLDSARNEGVVKTLFPADFELPMVAPEDVGVFAVEALLEPPEQGSPRMIEGPARYSSADVAAAFAKALRRPVRAVEIPESEWLEAYREMGFSAIASESYANMTRLTAHAEFPPAENVVCGSTTLDDYVAGLVRKNR